MPRKRLEPGQDNIASTKPHKSRDARGRTVWAMQWYINLNGQVSKHSTRRVGGTANDCRQQARAHADRLRHEARMPGSGGWTASSRMDEFVERVCRPLLMDNDYARPLRPRTLERTNLKLDRFVEQVRGMRICDLTAPNTLSNIFKRIAVDHGNPTAEMAASAARKYVFDVAVRMQILEYNPLRTVPIEVTVNESRVKPHRGQNHPKGGVAIRREDHERVITYLLDLDPTLPAAGGWTSRERTQRRATVIDLTLLQATCGLRLCEARSLRRRDVSERDGMLILSVSDATSKTHRGRDVPVLHKRVAHRLRERLKGLSNDPDAVVFPSLDGPNAVWDSSSCSRAIRALYNELADELDIPLLRTHATHVWRTTLNSEWIDAKVPAERRAAYFGHTVNVNRRKYTDMTDVSMLAGLVTIPGDEPELEEADEVADADAFKAQEIFDGVFGPIASGRRDGDDVGDSCDGHGESGGNDTDDAGDEAAATGEDGR